MWQDKENLDRPQQQPPNQFNPLKALSPEQQAELRKCVNSTPWTTHLLSMLLHAGGAACISSIFRAPVGLTKTIAVVGGMWGYFSSKAMAGIKCMEQVAPEIMKGLMQDQRHGEQYKYNAPSQRIRLTPAGTPASLEESQQATRDTLRSALEFEDSSSSDVYSSDLSTELDLTLPTEEFGAPAETPVTQKPRVTYDELRRRNRERQGDTVRPRFGGATKKLEREEAIPSLEFDGQEKNKYGDSWL